MRHLRIWAGLLALTVVAALVPAVASATPDDECEAAYVGEYDAAKLKAYLDCRLDRLERGLTPSPAPTVTVTPGPAPTVTVTATPAPAPTVTVTAPAPSATPTRTATATVTPSPPASGGFKVLGRTFPDASTTGIPSGTVLTAYTGPCTITTPNVVIDGKDVLAKCGELRVFGQNLTIRNSLTGSVYVDSDAREGSFTITDSKVDAGQGPGTGLGDTDFTATRVEVTGGTRSINCYRDCTVKDSYVHGQYHDRSGVHHESGIRVNTRSKVIGNTIACDAPNFPPDAGCSAALTGYPDFDPVTDNLVQGNLIRAGSGGYCAYGGSTSGKPFSGQTRNITFRDNVWERGTEMGAGGRGYVCGYWGPITSFDINAPGNVWTNNLYDDGTIVSPAN